MKMKPTEFKVDNMEQFSRYGDIKRHQHIKGHSKMQL
jgi:hypothetical protein